MEFVQTVKDFQIISNQDLSEVLKKYWLPDALNVNPLNLLYIEKVKNHIEIGKADIKLKH